MTIWKWRWLAQIINLRTISKKRGYHLIQAIGVVPIVVGLIVLTWRFNLYRTSVYTFHEEASDMLASMGDEMIQMSVSERLYAMFCSHNFTDKLEAFKSKWALRGIEVTKIEIKQQHWIQRGLILKCHYALEEDSLIWGLSNRKGFGELTVVAYGRIQSPFMEKRQWCSLGRLATEASYIEAPRVLFSRISSIWRTWLYRWLGG